jgi:hypothetical protein
MADAFQLPVDLFMLYHKNAIVDKLMQSQEGRDYLEDCNRLKQTKMDKQGLHSLLNTLNGGG